MGFSLKGLLGTSKRGNGGYKHNAPSSRPTPATASGHNRNHNTQQTYTERIEDVHARTLQRVKASEMAHLDKQYQRIIEALAASEHHYNGRAKQESRLADLHRRLKAATTGDEFKDHCAAFRRLADAVESELKKASKSASLRKQSVASHAGSLGRSFHDGSTSTLNNSSRYTTPAQSSSSLTSTLTAGSAHGSRLTPHGYKNHVIYPHQQPYGATNRVYGFQPR